MCPSSIFFLFYLLIQNLHRGKKKEIFFFLIKIIRINPFGSIGSSEYLQTILVQPKSVEVPVGATVILDCTVFNQYGDVAW
jgi:hypothetical protein